MLTKDDLKQIEKKGTFIGKDNAEIFYKNSAGRCLPIILVSSTGT